MSLAEKYFYEELLKISRNYANSFILTLEKEFIEKISQKRFLKSKSEFNLEVISVNDVKKPIRKNYSFTM